MHVRGSLDCAPLYVDSLICSLHRFTDLLDHAEFIPTLRLQAEASYIRTLTKSVRTPGFFLVGGTETGFILKFGE